MRAAGIDVLPSHVVEADFTYLGGREAMTTLIAEGRRPRAVFAANDLMALGALEACLAAGLRVPDDVAIAGFDDIEASRMVTPAITTVIQPGRWMGQEVGRLLVSRLAGDLDAPARVVPVTLELTRSATRPERSRPRNHHHPARHSARPRVVPRGA